MHFNHLIWRGCEEGRRKWSDAVQGAESLWLNRFASVSIEDLTGSEWEQDRALPD